MLSSNPQPTDLLRIADRFFSETCPRLLRAGGTIEILSQDEIFRESGPNSIAYIVHEAGKKNRICISSNCNLINIVRYLAHELMHAFDTRHLYLLTDDTFWSAYSGIPVGSEEYFALKWEKRARILEDVAVKRFVRWIAKNDLVIVQNLYDI